MIASAPSSAPVTASLACLWYPLGLLCFALSVIMTVGNFWVLIAAYWERRRGGDRGHSMLPLLGLLFGLGAWFCVWDLLGWWALVPAAVDPGTWILLTLPWVIAWNVRDARKRKQPEHTRREHTPH